MSSPDFTIINSNYYKYALTRKKNFTFRSDIILLVFAVNALMQYEASQSTISVVCSSEYNNLNNVNFRIDVHNSDGSFDRPVSCSKPTNNINHKPCNLTLIWISPFNHNCQVGVNFIGEDNITTTSPPSILTNLVEYDSGPLLFIISLIVAVIYYRRMYKKLKKKAS